MVVCHAAGVVAGGVDGTAADAGASVGFEEASADGPGLGLVEPYGCDDGTVGVAGGMDAAGALALGDGMIGPTLPHEASRAAVSEKASQAVCQAARGCGSLQTITMPPGRASCSATVLGRAAE